MVSGQLWGLGKRNSLLCHSLLTAPEGAPLQVKLHHYYFLKFLNTWPQSIVHGNAPSVVLHHPVLLKFHRGDFHVPVTTEDQKHILHTQNRYSKLLLYHQGCVKDVWGDTHGLAYLTNNHVISIYCTWANAYSYNSNIIVLTEESPFLLLLLFQLIVSACV